MTEHKGRAPDHEEHEEHLDEKWLVSYADMMTLLFGLFVMLFSIASENQGQIQEQLQKISNSSFNSSEPAPPPQPVTEAPAVPVDPTLEVKQELEEVRTQREALKKELEAQAQQQADYLKQIEEKTAAEEALARKIKDLEKETARLKSEKPVAVNPTNPDDKLKEEIRKLQQELQTVKKKPDVQADLQRLKEQLENEKAKTKQQEQELMAAKKKTAPAVDVQADVKKLKEQVEKEKTKALALEQEREKKRKDLQDELQQVKNQLEKEKNEKQQTERKVASVEQDQLKAKDLEKINKELTEKQKSLEAKLEEMQKEAKNQAQFMIVILKWSSEKHDLDLTVTDPSGKTFNFKNRKFAGHNGEFTLDSRSGPGAEIWQSDKVLPGTYTVTWKLYNTYGNDKPVVFSGFISSNRSRVPIPEGTFEAQSGKLQTIKIQADAKGNLTKL